MLGAANGGFEPNLQIFRIAANFRSHWSRKHAHQLHGFSTVFWVTSIGVSFCRAKRAFWEDPASSNYCDRSPHTIHIR